VKFFYLFLIVFVLASCEMDLTGFIKSPEKLSDQRFNGKFSNDISSVVYGRGSHTYKFDGTTYAVLESSQSYSSGYKLSYFEYEIEVSNGRYRKRLWKNDNSGSWDSWENYRFDSGGNLWIDLLEYKKK
jgi:hypothetical protein